MNDLCSKNVIYQRWLAGETRLWPKVEAAIKGFLEDHICQYFPGLNREEEFEMRMLSQFVFDNLVKAGSLDLEKRGTYVDACALVMRSVLVEMARTNTGKSQPQT